MTAVARLDFLTCENAERDDCEANPPSFELCGMGENVFLNGTPNQKVEILHSSSGGKARISESPVPYMKHPRHICVCVDLGQVEIPGAAMNKGSNFRAESGRSRSEERRSRSVCRQCWAFE
jgi:hypothetical protein